METIANTGPQAAQTPQFMLVKTAAWIADVEFWREETAFFYYQLQVKTERERCPLDVLAVISQDLNRLSTADLIELKFMLARHEQALREMTAAQPSEATQRCQHDHEVLKHVIQSFAARIRELKRTLFAFIKTQYPAL